MTPRMRLIKDAYAYIKEHDPDTCITLYYIRTVIKSGAVPSVRAGNKYYVNLDLLLNYLENPITQTPQAEIRGIRRVNERI